MARGKNLHDSLDRVESMDDAETLINEAGALLARCGKRLGLYFDSARDGDLAKDIRQWAMRVDAHRGAPPAPAVRTPEADREAQPGAQRQGRTRKAAAAATSA